MEQRATKMVDDLLAKHQVEPLNEEAQKAIHAIVEREQAWINQK
jgi:trimethylamine:corrinoid methyltransferase-like protein